MNGTKAPHEQDRIQTYQLHRLLYQSKIGKYVALESCLQATIGKHIEVYVLALFVENSPENFDFFLKLIAFLIDSVSIGIWISK